MNRQFVPVPHELGPAIGRRVTWSDAVRAGDRVYCTGQVGWDKQTGRIVQGGIEAQTEKALENLRETLARAGASLGHVVMVRVYLLSAADHERYDNVYVRFFSENPPARVTVVVADLCDEGSLIDIEAEALIE